MKLRTLALVLALSMVGSSAFAQGSTTLRSVSAHGTVDSTSDSVVLRTDNIGGFGSIMIQTLDSYTGTWEVQCAVDEDLTWDTDNELGITLVDAPGTVVYSIDNEVGIFNVLGASGCRAVRIAPTAGFSGSDTEFWIRATQSGGTGGGGGGGSVSSVTVTGGDGVPVGTIGTFSATLARPTVEVDPDTGDPVAYGTIWQLDIPFDPLFDAPGLLLRGKTAPVDQASVDDSLVAANSDQYGSLRILPSIGGVDLTATSTSLNVNLTNNTIGVEDVAETAGGNLAMIGAVVRAATSTVPVGSSATASDNATVNVDVAGLLWTRTVDPCSGSAKSFYSFDITSAATTELTGMPLAGSGNYYYICAVNIVNGGSANNVNLVDDNNDGCGSVTASLISSGVAAGDGWNFGANGGLTLGNGMGSVMKATQTNATLCLVTSASSELHGTFAVVAAP